MAFFPTYREIVCVVFPPRVKGLMLESWRQNRCSYGPVNNDEECPDLLPEECRVVPLL